MSADSSAVARVVGYLTKDVPSASVDREPAQEDLDKAREVLDSYQALVDPMTGRFTHVE